MTAAIQVTSNKNTRYIVTHYVYTIAPALGIFHKITVVTYSYKTRTNEQLCSTGNMMVCYSKIINFSSQRNEYEPIHSYMNMNPFC